MHELYVAVQNCHYKVPDWTNKINFFKLCLQTQLKRELLCVIIVPDTRRNALFVSIFMVYDVEVKTFDY